MLKRLKLLLALASLLPAGQVVRAQSTFHIDSAQPASAGTIALTGRLPDFTRNGYQVCVSPTAAPHAAPLSPTLVKGVATVPAPAQRPASVYIVRTGQPCNGTHDPLLSNAVTLKANGGLTPDGGPPANTKVGSVGTITATPNPVQANSSTTLTAQFMKDPATPNTAPEPGAPSGPVTFTVGTQTIPGSNLVLDSTAVFKPQAAIPLTVPSAAAPVITPATGTYTGSQTITISDATASALIYYTTDGTTPTAQSTLYGAPFTITTSTTVNAIAIAAGYANSVVSTAVYTLTFGSPAQLVFTTQPTNTGVTLPITPAVTVAVEDVNGNVVGNSTLPVTIALGANPAESTLSGTTTVSAVDGVATFSNLSLNALGNGYTLVASGPGIPAATSSAFNIIPYPITFSLPGTLIGIGATLPGSFTLSNPAPEGGVTVTLSSSTPANVTITPATVTVPAGQTTGSFTYSGVAAGASTLTASATGYTSATAVVTTTTSLISVGAIPTIAPGQTVDLPLSLATPAPPGGITVHFTSGSPQIATITPSIFVPAGQSVASANPQITGVTSGTSVITATATGYAPYVSIPPATVTVTATFPGSITINQSSGFNIQLSISYPAPVGGITFTLSSDSTSVVTLPASVTIVHGASSVQIPLTGVAPGQTTIRADSPGITEATSTVYVDNTINVGAITTGNLLEVGEGVGFDVAPPTPTTVTLTVANPAIATISTSGSAVGTASLTIPNLTGSYIGTIYFQGQSVGSTMVTVSAPGYATATATITVDPSGFAINGYYATFPTTTLSAPTSIQVFPAILTPGTLTYIGNATLNPGIPNISVPLTSSTPAAGTVSNSPLIFHAGDTQESFTFQPAAAGTTTLTLVTPTGFSTGSQYQSAVATVTAPVISVSDDTTGVKLQTSFGIALSQTAPKPVTVTVTSNNPAVALVSATGTSVGSTTATFASVTGPAGTLFVQGVSVGTTTLTISAPGFADATSNITVGPSGFAISGYYAGTNNTTTFSSPTTFPVYPAILNTSLAYVSNGTISPGVGTITLPITNSSTSVGAVTSPLTFNPGDTQQNATFTPAGAGTTTLTLSTPAGFSTGTQYQTSTFVVTAPPINQSDVTAGVKLQSGTGIGLSLTSPNPVTITVTSSNPAVALLSTSQTAVGSASLTFPNATSGPGAIYVQGISTGTATLTTSASGFQTATNTITVVPSGFVLNNSSFTTTTFSGPNGVSVVPALLDQNLNYAGYGTLSPGAGTVTVSLTDSNSGIGTLTNVPLSFTAPSGGQYATFTPVAAGATTLSLVPTPGFTTPNNDQSIVATVTAPGINTNDQTLGVNLESSVGIGLSQSPPNPVTITVISNGPAIAAISSDPTVAGGTTVTFPNSNGGTVYVQGLSLGTTTLTISAPGYSNAISHITVQPAGFAINTGDFTASVGDQPTQIQVEPYYLNPGTLTIASYPQTVSPTAGAVNVPMTSSNTAVGTISNAPLMFNGNSSSSDGVAYGTFTPLATGTSTILIGTPEGFSTPSQQQSITATVQ